TILRRVKLLIHFLPRSIRPEEIDRIFFLRRRPCRCFLPRLLLAVAIVTFIPQILQKQLRNTREGHHFLLFQLRKKYIPRISQQRRDQAKLPRLPRRHEIPPYIRRRRKRLPFHHPLDESRQKGSIAESHICKPRRRDFYLCRKSHQHQLHQFFGG